eukprot:8009103-Pyramimonas_sp.AAC.1
MAVAVKDASTSTAKARRALLKGCKAAYTSAPPTEKSCRPKERYPQRLFRKKGGGAAAQPAAITFNAITGRPQIEQATVKKEEKSSTWLPLPVTE